MNKLPDTELNLNKVTEFINNRIKGVWAIYLFGSFSKFISEKNQSFNKPNDIDLAVLLSDDASKNISTKDIWNISQELSVLLNKDIDLINVRNATTVMQKQIIDGLRIFTCSKFKREVSFYENYIDSSYVDLNEQRRLSIEDAIEKGSIYDK